METTRKAVATRPQRSRVHSRFSNILGLSAAQDDSQPKSFHLRTDKIHRWPVRPPCQQARDKTAVLPQHRTRSQEPLSRGVLEIITMKVPPLIPINRSDPAEKIPTQGFSLSLLRGCAILNPWLRNEGGMGTKHLYLADKSTSVPPGGRDGEKRFILALANMACSPGCYSNMKI